MKRIIVSKELKSFNISAFLLFLDFKYHKSLGAEALFWSRKVRTKVENFDNYFDAFMVFLTSNSLFTEYMKDLCHVDENTFIRLLNAALRNTVLIEEQELNLYGVDGFTTYDRKIYLKLFETKNPILNKAGTFYVLLHELCYYFRRVLCQTWEDSRNCRTPEEFINNRWQNEARNIFEIKYFGKQHKFLNESVCEYFLSSTENLSREQYSIKFYSINKSEGSIYIPLKRRSSPGKKDVIELRGCLISRYRDNN